MIANILPAYRAGKSEVPAVTICVKAKTVGTVRLKRKIKLTVLLVIGAL